MIIHYKEYFDRRGKTAYYLTDEHKIRLAKKNAAEKLARKIIENSEFKIDEEGNVVGTIEISEDPYYFCNF